MMMPARRYSDADRDGRLSDPTAIDPSPLEATEVSARQTYDGDLLPGTVVGDTY